MRQALDEVRETLDRSVLERDFSGTVLVTWDGEEWQGCFGKANRSDGVPITPRTRFGVASFTKLLTATTVVSLLSASELPYEARVVDLLPPERRPLTLRDDVTVHHLLSHTSGIADYYEESEDADGYARLWTTLPSYTLRTPMDFLPLYGDRPPYQPPGQGWRYSNAGYLLLGLLIEELSGEPYVEAVHRRVLAPAGMADSGFFALEDARPHVATGYLRPIAEGLPWRSNIFAIPAVGGPDGGLFATAHDVDRFLRAFGEARLVGGSERNEMLRPHAVVREDIACGYGFLLHEGPGGVRWGHDGLDPGVEVQAYRWRDLDLSMVILCNVTGFTSEVRQLVLDVLFGG